jgi:hypothetical protein
VRSFFVGLLIGELLLGGFLTASRSMAGPRGACTDTPLFEASVGAGSLLGSAPFAVGAWPLPVSASNPKPMKSAQVTLDLLPDGDELKAQAYFSFIDPTHPWGIPYSFTGVEMDWETDAATGHAEIDFSDGCSSVGRSMFPGQAWPVFLRLDGWKADVKKFRQIRLRVWGGRG